MRKHLLTVNFVCFDVVVMKIIGLGLLITCLAGLAETSSLYHEQREGSQPIRNSKQIPRDDHDFNIVEFIRQSLLDHGDELVEQVAALLNDVDNQEYDVIMSNSSAATPWQCPDAGPTNCPRTTVLPVLNAPTRLSLVQNWYHLVGMIRDDSEGCLSCIEIFSSLQQVICDGMTWEWIRDLLMEVCQLIFPLTGVHSSTCNALNLQGPHVYCVTVEAEPRAVCESLGNCYPDDPRPDRRPVSQRTPWVVKEEENTAGTDPKAGRTGRTGPKVVADELLMVAQLSDIHMQTKHAVGAPSDCNNAVCCLDYIIARGNARAREWGEYLCNIPPRTVDLFLDRVHQANPHFIIYAGDSPPNTMWDETLESQLNCSQNIINAMEKTLGTSIKVYPNIGNHEMFPTNLFSLRMPETNHMMDQFASMWERYAGLDATQMANMRKLAYYTTQVPDHPNLRIMSINTNYDWYNMNFYNALNQHTPELGEYKQWVWDTLEAARTNDERVIIIGHHPIGSAIVRAARWWEEVAKEFGDVIVLHVSGHTHAEDIKLSFDPDTMEARAVNLVGASTTSNTFVNPTMKMFYLDPQNNYEVVDYEIFYMDVKTQNQSIGVPPAIVYSYSAKKLYGMSDLSPNSWKKLVLRFIDDDDLFQAYYTNKNSGATLTDCDYGCKVSAICAIWFPDPSERSECRQLAPPAPSTTTTTLSPTVGDGAGQLLHSVTLPFTLLILTYIL